MQDGIYIIDRIENGIALCETETDLLPIALQQLPPGSREGSVIRVQDGQAYLDEAEAMARKVRARTLLNKLRKKSK